MRKVLTLLDCGALITVVSPEMHPELAKLAAENKITACHREYRDTDLNGIFLVIGATDDGNLRETFLALAQEEAKHKLRFELEYDDYVLKEN